ncbi:MAG: type II secretion system F family protein [Planctomycetales bacterium]|nr:type II secretion system F family protein [Planctomycetales bacterium]
MMPLLATCLVFASVFLLVECLEKFWDQIAQRFVAEQMRQAQAIGLDTVRIRRALRWWGLSCLAVLILGWVFQALPIAVALLVLLLLAPKWSFAWAIRSRQDLLRDQMVGCTVALANAARAGQSLTQGLQAVSQECPQPLGGELQRIVAEYHLGRALPETLLEAKQRLRIDSFTMFASAITVSLERGGRVTDSLEKISRSLRENQRIERKLAAETASGWRVVMILTAFPFLFLAGFFVLHPEGTGLMFSTLVGQSLVLMIMGLIVVSVWWSRRILRIEL